MSNVTGGAFGRWLGPESGAFMHGISALMKDNPESSFYHVRAEVCTSEGDLHTTMFAPSPQTSNLQPPEPWEINSCS